LQDRNCGNALDGKPEESKHLQAGPTAKTTYSSQQKILLWSSGSNLNILAALLRKINENVN
jgi:hypothetical protein